MSAEAETKVMDKEEGGIDELEEDKSITLVSGDEKKFEISAKYASISEMIKSTLLDKETKEIKLKDISGTTLEKVVEYMKARKGVDMEEMKWPIKHKTMKENVGKGNEWCAEFIDNQAKHRKNFYDLLLATVRLDIKGLQNLGVGKIACMLKFCAAEDLDRVLDPAIQDGKLLPLRQEIIEERKKEEAERQKKREERKKAQEAKNAEEKKAEKKKDAK
mmetsp:Transcript_10101/g.15128  ORF Transcript_10101/g.15128 Transcript_10101/m.15128 type:complete len:218 (+) Transcript_10101:77-730(+)|eukprot:CAMPEP_0167757710 /NCGR_PEP_ID=MMETSP0110_2-20121227/10075_1 /TAXON_ID=629695 /ORGANISM="Gymnochlora sp., Strain CCMP2014" /LENGTH=217 /DNA_ID=CAMNT_0007643927 /DNA_START=51 /DNA_END=704 /DNA_ORIENTATION=+